MTEAATNIVGVHVHRQPLLKVHNGGGAASAAPAAPLVKKRRGGEDARDPAEAKVARAQATPRSNSAIADAMSPLITAIKGTSSGGERVNASGGTRVLTMKHLHNNDHFTSLDAFVTALVCGDATAAAAVKIQLASTLVTSVEVLCSVDSEDVALRMLPRSEVLARKMWRMLVARADAATAAESCAYVGTVVARHGYRRRSRRSCKCFQYRGSYGGVGS